MSPAPYYEDDAVTIYHGDCRKVLPLTSDAVITDPPYGTAYYATDGEGVNAYLLGQFLVNGSVAVFGWPERLAALCIESGVVPDEWITWWPRNARMRGFNRVGLWREVECIAVFGPGEWGRLRQPRRPTTTPMPERNKRVKGATGPVRMGDVWTEESPNINPRQSHKRRHPNEKPQVVIERLILALTEPGDVVLDPFMGSGTTLSAARATGRRAIGIEVEELYCEIAVDRLAQEVLDLGAAA